MTAPGALRFLLLGRLQVVRGEEERTPTADKQRTILALLLLNANQLVRTDELIAELWGGAPPKSARPALHGYLTSLRRSLGHGPGRDQVLRTGAGGYLLSAAPGQLDLDRSRQLAAAGRAALAARRYPAARFAFDEARDLWRGTPLGDVTHTVGMIRHLARLEEEHLLLVQGWAEAMLGSGAGPEIIPELEELSARYPLRESLYCHLMLALDQADRRADALAAYARAYRVLTTEIGIEPGARLRAAHRTLLDAPLSRPVAAAT